MISIDKISGIAGFSSKTEKIDEKMRELYLTDEGRVFLVENKNTIEVRCDYKLGKLLTEKYESVMESRYFGRGGIEIVDSGQLEDNEIEDLIRLSYNISKEMEEK